MCIHHVRLFTMPTCGLLLYVCVALFFHAGPHSPDLDSPSLNNQHAPIPYDQLHHHHQTPSPGKLSPVTTQASTPSGGGGGYSSGNESCGGGSKSLSLPHRIPHPLKSFSVPGPPPQTSAPNTPVPIQHIGMLCLLCESPLVHSSADPSSAGLDYCPSFIEMNYFYLPA